MSHPNLPDRRDRALFYAGLGKKLIEAAKETFPGVNLQTIISEGAALTNEEIDNAPEETAEEFFAYVLGGLETAGIGPRARLEDELDFANSALGTTEESIVILRERFGMPDAQLKPLEEIETALAEHIDVLSAAIPPGKGRRER